MADVDPRVNGTEMEWAVMARHHVTDDVVPLGSNILNGHLRWYQRELVGYENQEVRQFLPNGSRLYVDCGDHLEYATPETTSFTQALAAELAGEQVVRKCLAARPPIDIESTNYGQYFLHKRVADRYGNTSGYHESYQAAADRVPVAPESLSLAAAHVATRHILFGAGFLTADGDFLLSQKATSVRKTFEGSTMSADMKPIITLRQEKLAGKEWSRVQVVAGDPNMSPWATRLRLASTRIVMRMQEYGVDVPDVDIKDPPQAMKAINRSLGQDKFELSSGTYSTAAEVQQQFIEAGKRLAAEGLLTDEEMDALDEWDKAITDFRQNPELLYNRADWVLRHRMLAAQKEKHGYDWGGIALRNIDLTWDLMGEGGIGERLREGIWASHMPDAELVSKLRDTAPHDTRAHARARFIQAFCGLAKNAQVDWHQVRFEGTTIQLDDPREPYNQKLEDLISSHPRSRLAA